MLKTTCGADKQTKWAQLPMASLWHQAHRPALVLRRVVVGQNVNCLPCQQRATCSWEK